MQGIICLIVLSILSQGILGEFILPSIDIDDVSYETCGYCDERSDRAGSRTTAISLREFMTRNFIKIVVDSGDVAVSENLPNEAIDTGHSCKITAEAQNIIARARMIPGTVDLGPTGVLYIDEIQNSIAIGEVEHKLSVDLNVRVWGGTKIFRKCHKYARKTCSTNGYSIGRNKIVVNFAASNVLLECIAGQMHLTFNMDVKAYNEVQNSTYSPVQVAQQNNCNLNILGVKIGSINGIIQRYANRYVQAGDKFYELRGAKLVSELENKLGVQLGSTVSVKLNHPDGTPRLCPAGRKKRDASCTRKTCPEDFTRIGETEMCQKFMGTRIPDCSVYGTNAVLHERDIGRVKIYWCWTPRV